MRNAMTWYQLEAATGGVLLKKVFLKISQNSYENTCARLSFLIQKDACNFIKKETLAQVFSCEFCEILRTPFLQNTSGRYNIFFQLKFLTLSFISKSVNSK